MQYTKLGNSDLNVSRICMGCMGFGDAQNGQHTWTVDEEHSREIIKQGLELGVNFFDTAIAYQSGTSRHYYDLYRMAATPVKEAAFSRPIRSRGLRRFSIRWPCPSAWTSPS